MVLMIPAKKLRLCLVLRYLLLLLQLQRPAHLPLSATFVLAEERASASFRPPQTTGSAHPPAWRSPEAARDAEDRANAALRADAARREAEETAARAKAKAKAKAAATTAESRGRVPIRVEGINTSLCDVMQRKPGSVAVGAGGAAQALELFLGDFSFSPRRAALRQRFSWQRFREAHTEASQGAPQSTALGAGDSPAGVPVPPAESPRHFGWHLEFDPSMLAKRKTEARSEADMVTPASAAGRGRGKAVSLRGICVSSGL